MCSERRHICLGFTDEPYPEGTHICYLYNDDEERRRILPLFARHALLEHEAFHYVADVPDRPELPRVKDELELTQAERGLDSRIEIATVAEGYYPTGRFDPDEMLARLRASYEESVAKGKTGARFAGGRCG